MTQVVGADAGAVRVLVPPSRPEANPLLFMLRQRGLHAIEFPHLRSGPPPQAELQRALGEAARADWIVFSGGASADCFLQAGGKPGEARLCAIGHAAEQALRKAGLPVSAAPRGHIAVAVAEELGAAGGVRGQRMLLLRADGATRQLPEELARRGAVCVELVGYSIEIESPPDEAAHLLAGELGAVVFANPSAVRVLARAARQLGTRPEELVRGALCATAGPVTAEEARRHRMTPSLSVKPREGRSLMTLAAALVERLQRS